MAEVWQKKKKKRKKERRNQCFSTLYKLQVSKRSSEKRKCLNLKTYCGFSGKDKI